jgi:methylenetetrahydrofolate dehydrogenase (NADP+)/methenyltetrahydrofolate cyclohydrolase
MQIIEGKVLAAQILSEIKTQTSALEKKPRLDIIFVGDDQASAAYISQKQQAGAETEIVVNVHKFPEISLQDLGFLIEQLNVDAAVNAIIVQLPLPDKELSNALSSIEPKKDVDGLNALSLGRLWHDADTQMQPATPAAIIAALDYVAAANKEQNFYEGRNALVINRSLIIGKPLSAILLSKNCTVTIAHSKTRNLSELIHDADIIVTGTGNRELIKPEQVKSGCVLIDAAFNKIDGKVYGDIDTDLFKDKDVWLSPVPGGIGPLGVAMLLKNTLEAAKSQNTL